MRLSRRRALRAGASAATGALAGCFGARGGPGDRETTGSRTPSPGGTTASSDGPETPDRVAADWPMPGHDPGRSSYSRASAGPTERIAELWTAAVGAALSAPVLADGTLYVGGGDGAVRAFDARTGERRWEHTVGAPAGTPRASDGRLYVPTPGTVVALDRSDGAERWRVDTPGRADLLVAPHGVYWTSRGATPVVALAREDGSERWRTELPEPRQPHLFAGGGSVFVSTGSHGRFPWTLDPETGESTGRTPASGSDLPAERFYLDGTVYAADGFFGTVVATPVAAGEKGWSRGLDAYGEYALGGGADHVYYVAPNGGAPGLYALARADGAVEWMTDAVAGAVGRPVASGECVLVRTDGALRCFDPADGSERWSHPADGVGERFVVADDLVYTTREGTLRAFRPP